MGSSVLESRYLVTTLYFINVLQSMLLGGGGDQAGLLSLIDNRGTEGSRGHVPCSRSPATPCCCYGNSGCWEHGAGRTDGSLETTSGGEPRSSVPPTCPGALESGGRLGPPPLKRPFPSRLTQVPRPQLGLICRNKHHQGHV